MFAPISLDKAGRLDNTLKHVKHGNVSELGGLGKDLRVDGLHWPASPMFVHTNMTDEPLYDSQVYDDGFDGQNLGAEWNLNTNWHNIPTSFRTATIDVWNPAPPGMLKKSCVNNGI